MSDFLRLTGVMGVACIAIVFIVAFCLAKPNKEFSFLGIKLHKKRVSNPFYIPRKYPKPTPESWLVVFNIFGNADTSSFTFDTFYYHARGAKKELEVRLVVDEMIKHRLIIKSFNHITLTPKGLEKVLEVRSEAQ